MSYEKFIEFIRMASPKIIISKKSEYFYMIGIYSNSKTWGGVEVLVTRLAEYLYKRDIPFCVIEPPGTRLHEDLRWAKLIDPSSTGLLADQIRHLFLPNVAKLQDPDFPRVECGGARLFSWVVHPNEPFRSFFPFSGKLLDSLGYKGVALLQALMPRHSTLLQSLFNLLCTGKSLAVMDGATTRALHFFYPSLTGNPILIPIPAPEYAACSDKKIRASEIAIGYLGRLDAFKFSALGPFVDTELRRLAKLKSVQLHLVAEGPHMKKLREVCANAKVSLHEHGFQPNATARQTIFSQTDLAVTMGTAALDIASTGQACMIIDPALGKMARPQTSFRLVHEIEMFTLGEYRDFPGYVEGLHDFNEIIELSQTETISNAAKDYVTNHHALDKSFGSLIKAIDGSMLTVAEVGEVMRDVESSFKSLRHCRLRNLIP
ncbi:MAG: hypothetical protein PHE55_04875 [Methylococcaceae bacterium]|nr:hypothetical protein [Methylococcaceae bacterium]